MKRWMLLPLAFLMVVPASLAAQEEAAPTWWAVFSEHVPPSNVMAFEENSKAMMELIRANAPAELVYYTHAGPETGYMYTFPMTGMGDFMTLNEQWMGMIEKIGWEKWEEMSPPGLTERTSFNFYVEMLDQSYHPEGFVESLPDKPFRRFDLLYPKTGMEDEFNDVLKEWVSFYAEHGLEAGWTAYQAVSGDNLPLVVLITPAASARVFHELAEQEEAIVWEAGTELWTKTMEMLRGYESDDANFRPELSLLPDEM